MISISYRKIALTILVAMVVVLFPPSLHSLHASTPGTWEFTTGSMQYSRTAHTATLLTNGKVLITGGIDFNSGGMTLPTAEFYDPSSEMFSPANDMNTPRANHTATLLPDGRVLIAGGAGSGGNQLNSAELYDPEMNTFTLLAAQMQDPRQGHTATLLDNGKVLITGGWYSYAPSGALLSAALYDPATETFASTSATMNYDRAWHSATLLLSGKVLISGGASYAAGGSETDTAELYDPVTDTFTLTGSMKVIRHDFAAVLLANGKVLIAGGSNNSGALASAELYDPVNGTFSFTAAMNDRRANLQFSSDSVALLPDGKVLVPGGSQFYPYDEYTQLASVDLYDPGTGVFLVANPMNEPRGMPSVTLLANGNVLVAGGAAPGGYTGHKSAELYFGAPQDSSPPSTSATKLPLPNSSGWNSGDVSVTLNAVDNQAGSGVKEIHYALSGASSGSGTVSGSLASVSITAEGTTLLQYWAVDKAGNSETAQSLEVKIDRTPPEITISGITNGSSYTLGAVPLAGYLSIDDISGVASQSAILTGGNANGVGSFTYTVTVTDHAGNTSVKGATYQVSYNFSGFQQPVSLDKPFKLGSTIPVKFQLTDASGSSLTTAIATLSLKQYSGELPVGDPIDAISTSGADSGNMFRYDSQYIFNLNTRNLSTGTWQVSAKLDDGRTMTAYISLK